jgi:hypothetical protein
MWFSEEFNMLSKKILALALVALQLVLAGCYQSHSDDDLRTVPATNNPHIIGHTNPPKSVPGAGF